MLMIWFLFTCDKEFLKSSVLKIKDYLQKELGLTLHPKKIYLQYFKKGVYFLGVFIKPYRIYIGRKTKQNFYSKIRIWNEVEKEKATMSNEKIKKFIACPILTLELWDIMKRIACVKSSL